MEKKPVFIDHKKGKTLKFYKTDKDSKKKYKVEIYNKKDEKEASI